MRWHSQNRRKLRLIRLMVLFASLAFLRQLFWHGVFVILLSVRLTSGFFVLRWTFVSGVHCSGVFRRMSVWGIAVSILIRASAGVSLRSRASAGVSPLVRGFAGFFLLMRIFAGFFLLMRVSAGFFLLVRVSAFSRRLRVGRINVSFRMRVSAISRRMCDVFPRMRSSLVFRCLCGVDISTGSGLFRGAWVVAFELLRLRGSGLFRPAWLSRVSFFDFWRFCHPDVLAWTFLLWQTWRFWRWFWSMDVPGTCQLLIKFE